MSWSMFGMQHLAGAFVPSAGITGSLLGNASFPAWSAAQSGTAQTQALKTADIQAFQAQVQQYTNQLQMSALMSQKQYDKLKTTFWTTDNTYNTLQELLNKHWPGLKCRYEYVATARVRRVFIYDSGNPVRCSYIDIPQSVFEKTSSEWATIWREMALHLDKLRKKGELIQVPKQYQANSVWFNNESNTWTGTWNADRELTLNSGDTLELTWQYNIDQGQWSPGKAEEKVEIKLTLKEAQYLESKCAQDETLKAILAKIEEEVDFQIVVSFRKDDD